METSEEVLVYNPNRRRKKGNSSSPSNSTKGLHKTKPITIHSTSKSIHPTSVTQIQPKDDCHICCEPIDYYSIGDSCPHSEICYSCSIKSIVICSQTNCIFCKNERKNIIFSRKKDLQFNDFPYATFPKANFQNSNFTFYFEDDTIKTLSESLFEFKCKICTQVLPTEILLRKHLENQHRKFFCQRCLEHRKLFIKEQEVFSNDELRHHCATFTENASSKTKGHPNCKFCDTTFYDSEHLYFHMEKFHISCRICHEQYQYFANLAKLQEHYRSDHYYCEEEGCVDAAFADEIDLKAHQIERHKYSKSEKKKLIKIDIGFTPTNLRNQKGNSRSPNHSNFQKSNTNNHSKNNTKEKNNIPNNQRSNVKNRNNSNPNSPNHLDTQNTKNEEPIQDNFQLEQNIINDSISNIDNSSLNNLDDNNIETTTNDNINNNFYNYNYNNNKKKNKKKNVNINQVSDNNISQESESNLSIRERNRLHVQKIRELISEEKLKALVQLSKTYLTTNDIPDEVYHDQYLEFFDVINGPELFLESVSLLPNSLDKKQRLYDVHTRWNTLNFPTNVPALSHSLDKPPGLYSLQPSNAKRKRGRKKEVLLRIG